MTRPAAEVFRVERDQGTTPLGKRNKEVRALGTALTGLPMLGGRMTFDATLRILDDQDALVYEKYGESREIDALEMQILQDLMRLDEDAFRAEYGFADPR